MDKLYFRDKDKIKTNTLFLKLLINFPLLMQTFAHANYCFCCKKKYNIFRNKLYLQRIS